MAIPTALRVGIAEPLSIDPAHVDSAGGLQVIAQAFDGLVSTDPETQALVPAAARRWDVLEGGRVIEFHLREGATFHDGAGVEAADFAFAWNRLADPATRSPFAFLLEGVEGYREYHILRQGSAVSGIQPVDGDTLRVVLTRPWPGFVALTAHPALSPVPPQAGSVDFDAQPVGNGPYRVAVPWDLGQPIELRRFERYAGPPPTVDQLVFHVYDRDEEGWPDFLAGDLDVATVPTDLIPDAESRYGSAGLVTLARLLYCGFNLTREAFRDVRLRRAFSLALDRAGVAGSVYGSVSTPATGIVPPTVPGFDPSVCGPACTEDTAEAARLIAPLPEELRSFELEVIDTEVGRRLAEAIAAQLEPVGLDVRPRLLGEEAFGERLRRGDQGAFCLVWDADTATQQGMLEPILATGSPDNHSKVSAPRLDRALDAGRSAVDDAARARAYRDAEAIAMEIMPVVPVVWFRSHIAVQPYVRGFRLDPLGRFDAAAIELLPEGPEPGPSPTP